MRRKRQSPQISRGQVVGFHLTRSEKQRLIERAKTSTISIAEYVRRLALSTMEVMPLAAADPEAREPARRLAYTRIYVTPDEKLGLYLAARVRGISLNKYLRDLVLAELARADQTGDEPPA